MLKILSIFPRLIKTVKKRCVKESPKRSEQFGNKYKAKKRRYPQVFLFIILVVFIIISNILAGSRSHQATVTFLADDEFMPSLLKDIVNSNESIYCAIYMFKTDGADNEPTGLIVTSMIDAANRGVDTHVLLDLGQGDDITTGYNRYTSKRLLQAGATIYFDEPERRLHTKMCIIDRKISYIGSHNYTYSAMKRNSEVSVRIESSGVAEEGITYIKGFIKEI